MQQFEKEDKANALRRWKARMRSDCSARACWLTKKRICLHPAIAKDIGASTTKIEATSELFEHWMTLHRHVSWDHGEFEERSAQTFIQCVVSRPTWLSSPSSLQKLRVDLDLINGHLWN